MRRSIVFLACVAGLAAALAACSKPDVPDQDDRPEPQAAATPGTATPPSQLREAIQQPIDQAEAVKAATEAAAQQRREAIDAAASE